MKIGNVPTRFNVKAYAILVFFALFSIYYCLHGSWHSAANTRPKSDSPFEDALYSHVDLFGTPARIARPSEDARVRLKSIIEKNSQDTEARIRLAKVCEALQDFAGAEEQLKAVAVIEKESPDSLRKLEKFYHERANFLEEARTLQRLLVAVPQNEKGEIFYELSDLAEQHRLFQFLDETEYGSLIKDDPEGFNILQKLVSNFISKEKYDQALALLSGYEKFFPNEREYFISKRSDALYAKGDIEGAEAIYISNFDPFWSEQLSRSFYGLLNQSNRYRNYQRQLREEFLNRPRDFNLAARLFHLCLYESEPQQALKVLRTLEKARTKMAGQGEWSPTELATVGQLYMSVNEMNEAGRYFYTLHLQGGLPKGGIEREVMLYRLFRTLIDAEDERTILSAGDLGFYKDIAESDQHPGLLGGILSLILADSYPSDQYASAEIKANRYFNQATAYRILTAYDNEYPNSPVLPNMYADLIEIYARLDQKALVDQLSSQFQQRFQSAKNYPDMCLKIADVYVEMKQKEKVRKIYQNLLDYFGARRSQDNALMPRLQLQAWETHSRIANRHLSYLVQFTSDAPTNANEDLERDEITPEDTNDEMRQSRRRYYGRYSGSFNMNALEPVKLTSSVAYSSVFDRYVNSLASDKANEKILALYWQEIKKYPKEEGLYERFLQWLDKIQLIDAQLKAYRMAILNVPNNKTWQARLARWYIRNEREKEFAEISERLLKILDESEAQEYLQIFIKLKQNDTNESDYDAQLYYQLYKYAQTRFPENQVFVNGLLNYYRKYKKDNDYLELTLQYYFMGTRDQALQELASRDQLKTYYAKAQAIAANNELQTAYDDLNSVAYEQFRADAAIWFSEFEVAVDAYRKLYKLYPGNEEYGNRLAMLLRSFGQQSEDKLKEAMVVKDSLATVYPINESYRTEAGELRAELGDFNGARKQWDQLLSLARGNPEIYLETASIFWDYYQYDDALRVIEELRKAEGKSDLYAFQEGVIFENKHNKSRAVAEYVKCLSSYELELPCIYRLKKLAMRPAMREMIAGEVKKQFSASPNNYRLIVGYARLLDRIGDVDAAAQILNHYIPINRDLEFLHLARGFFAAKNRVNDEARALERLAEVADNGLPMISYKRQLASLYEQQRQPDSAAAIYDGLLKKMPNNYGLIVAGMKFYWRNGYRDRTIDLLKGASERGLGAFHFEFGLKLAEYQEMAGLLPDAESTLRRLYSENIESSEIMSRLMSILVKEKKHEELLAVYREAYKRAIAKHDKDRLGRSESLAQLHSTMEKMLDDIGDYPGALEQRISLVNNDANSRSDFVGAYEYARRHNLLPMFTDYYRKLSEQADKNYRWNLILARIIELQGEWRSAVPEYQKAIRNEPQMVELYRALADVYLQLKQPQEAIAQLERAFELSYEDAYYKKLISEIGKLKFDQPIARDFLKNIKPDTPGGSNTITYVFKQPSEVFDKFRSDIYSVEIYQLRYYMSEYALSKRSEIGITGVFDELWKLRTVAEKEVLKPNNPNVQAATSILNNVDLYLPEALADASISGEDLFALNDHINKIISTSTNSAIDSSRETVLLAIAQKCGLQQTIESIMLKRLDSAYKNRDAVGKKESSKNGSDYYHTQLASMIDFYADRGLFNKAIDLLKNEYEKDDRRTTFDYKRRLALLSNYINDSEGELTALREYYKEKTGGLTTARDELIERYFTLVTARGGEGRKELAELVVNQHPFRLQLINFLIKQGERALAYQAISGAPLTDLWKLARRAEAASAMGDFSRETEQVFRRALGSQTIGDIIKSRPNPSSDLVGDDWFQLAAVYGRWLSHKPEGNNERITRAFLPARIENRPRDAMAHRELGRLYLEDKNFSRAVEHFELALKLQPVNRQVILDLAETHWRAGRSEQARIYWQKIIGEDNPSIAALQDYYLALDILGLTGEAREKLKPIIAKKLSSQSEETQGEIAALQMLIRSIAYSEPSRAKDYLLDLVTKAPSRPIIEMIINEELAPKADRLIFIRKLIPLLRENEVVYNSAYRDYITKTNRLEDIDDIEDQYTRQQTDKYVDGYGSNKTWLDWRRDFIEELLAQGQKQEALEQILLLEKAYHGQAPRPVWLRLAHIKANFRMGNKKDGIESLLSYCRLKSDLRSAGLPDMKRAVEAADLLKREKLDEESRNLLGNAYRKMLAFGQFEVVNFIGYAEVEFSKKNPENALKTLSVMIETAQPDISPIKLNQIAESYRTPAEEALASELPEIRNSVSLDSALSAAAEAAARFGSFEESINYERQWIALNGVTDVNHRLEFASLLAGDGRLEMSAQILTELLAIRRISYEESARAVALLARISQKSPSLISSAAKNTDRLSDEKKMLLKAIELQSEKKWSEAAQTLDVLAAGSINPMIPFLQGVTASHTGEIEKARDGFAAALLADPQKKIITPFTLIFEEPSWQVIRLYLQSGRVRGAIYLASKDPRFSLQERSSQNEVVESEIDDGLKMPIDQTMRRRTFDSQRELLVMLSDACERIGEFDQAIKFERVHVNLLGDYNTRIVALRRIEALNKKLQEKAKQSDVNIDLRLVSQR